jgi:Predicted membrane protein
MNILTELALIGILVAAGVASNLAFRNNSTAMIGGISISDLILLICLVISIIVLISGFLDFLRWNSEQIVITDRRVLQIRGVFNKRVIDSSLEKINDIELRQSIIGRIFNFGTIEILTASGAEGANVMGIEAPLEFKRALLEAKHNLERGYGYLEAEGYIPSRPVSSVTEIQRTLEELARLRDRGILSPEEFEGIL